jgi:Ca2+-binding RTX toxin-like protein
VATLTGTAGDDIFVLKAFGKDTVVEGLNQGTDLVKASFDHALANNVENLTLTNNNVMLGFDFGGGDVGVLARPADPTRAIVGSWQVDDDTGRSVITFLSDGTYMHVQNGPAVGAGHSGVEVGRYTWNSSTGAVTISNITADTNGDWGLSDTPLTHAVVEGNGLTAMITGESNVLFTRVVSASPIVGSWYSWNAPEAKGIAIVTFFADGTYMFGQDGSSALDPSGMDGMEYGTYEYNPTTGLVTYSTTTDTNGEWGLSLPSDPGGSVTVALRGANGTGNALANTLTGDGMANTLSGLGGNDILKGNGGNDKLLGAAGADQLYGGTGKDVLNGGAGGADKFYFDVAATAGNADTVQGFEHGLDKIILDDDIFTAFAGFGSVAATKFQLGTAADDSNDYLIYDQSAGKLYYDADGNGAGAKLLIATLSGNPVLDATDFKVVA